MHVKRFALPGSDLTGKTFNLGSGNETTAADEFHGQLSSANEPAYLTVRDVQQFRGLLLSQQKRTLRSPLRIVTRLVLSFSVHGFASIEKPSRSAAVRLRCDGPVEFLAPGFGFARGILSK
jgi:hypothetical protein